MTEDEYDNMESAGKKHDFKKQKLEVKIRNLKANEIKNEKLMGSAVLSFKMFTSNFKKAFRVTFASIHINKHFFRSF